MYKKSDIFDTILGKYTYVQRLSVNPPTPYLPNLLSITCNLPVPIYCTSTNEYPVNPPNFDPPHFLEMKLWHINTNTLYIEVDP